MIEIRNLCKRYDTADGVVVALDDVSLSVGDGEFVAVVGQSGSGKTTLLNMIGGLDVPDRGSIHLDKEIVTNMPQKKLAQLRRRKVGIIYQFYNLVPELTVGENVTLPVELDGEAPDMERLSRILDTVRLSGRENSYPANLSGGQQQRVAIARALYGNPSLILADEPTGNLDAENSSDVLSLLAELNREHNVTLIVVTHSKEVAASAKRVVTLRDGRVVTDERC